MKKGNISNQVSFFKFLKYNKGSDDLRVLERKNWFLQNFTEPCVSFEMLQTKKQKKDLYYIIFETFIKMDCGRLSSF